LIDFINKVEDLDETDVFIIRDGYNTIKTFVEEELTTLKQIFYRSKNLHIFFSVKRHKFLTFQEGDKI
jgi:hypothetical protein